MNTLVLIDPQSGHEVNIRPAGLAQKCEYCGRQMQGELIAYVEGSGTGWHCFTHLERILLNCELSDKFRARADVRVQMRRLAPGDTVTVTRQMLIALEVG